MIGTRVGQYLIESQLGAGAMGVVYRAHDTRLERSVAIKVFPDLAGTPKARQRLMHEGRSASALNHPNVCTIYEVGESGETMYLVMEFIEGRTLAALIPSGGFPVDTVAMYGSQIASALAHAHARGVVHRDLKSANVVVTPDGRAKVLDFGLAQRKIPDTASEAETVSRVHDTFLSPGGVAGTLAYMAPEALRGEMVDGRADIWALGVMLYEMATGSLPFRGQTLFDVSGRVLHESPAPLPQHIPPTLRAIVARCLAKDRGQRYQDAAELRSALDTVHAGTATTPAPVGSEPSSAKRALLVLPFANLAADPESDYFVDGLTEEIIADLSNLRQLRVISSTSSRQLKGTTLTVAELAKQLRVGYVLEGSVRRVGGLLRVTAKLIEAATDSPVWGNKYSGTLEDVFAIQETLSRSIVDALRLALTVEEAKKLKEHPIADARAYEWYLRAKQEMLRFSKDSLDRAVECLEKSEAIAGENVLLLAAKGEAYWQYINQGASADRSYLDKSEAAIRRALEIDPQSPHAQRVAGLVRLHRGDIQGALRHLKRALDLDPNDPDSLFWGSMVAAQSGKTAVAEPWAARLVEVDPVTPFYQLAPGSLAWFKGDYERAWALFSEQQAATLENPLMRLIYAQATVASGRTDQGNRILDDLARTVPDSPFGQLASVYRHALEGDREQVLTALTPSLIATLEGDPQYCLFLGHCHALVGEVDAGIRWVEAAVALGCLTYDLFARLDPFLSNLRGDPRFAAIIEGVKHRSNAIQL